MRALRGNMTKAGTSIYLAFAFVLGFEVLV